MTRTTTYAVGALLVALVALGVTGCGGSTPTAGPAGTTARTDASGPSGPVTLSPTPTPAVSPTPTPRQPRQPTVSISVPAELRSTAPDRELLGADMSWPQCPPGTGIPQKQGQGSPYPLSTARFVLLGLTNGPGFTPNPCLASQVAWVKEHRLQAAAYSVVSHPDAATLAGVGGTGPYDAGSRLGRLRNAGYQQALFNLTTMRRAGLTSPIVWIDVEPVPDFDWPADPTANAAVVVGAVRGYRESGFTVGVYSTPVLWHGVVGDLRLGLPEWRAAGETSRAEARSRCGADWVIQGGTAALAQWLEDGRDQNITCPGTSVRMAVWFHQY